MTIKKILSISGMLFLFFIVISLIQTSASAVNVLKLDQDYSRTVERDSTQEFRWGLFYPDTNISYSLEIDVHYDRDWEFELSQSDFELNKTTANHADITEITLTISTLNSKYGDTATFTVNFTFSPQDNVAAAQITKTMTCSVTIKSSISSSGLDLFGFEIGLPEEWDVPLVRFGISLGVYIIVGLLLYFILIPLIRNLTKKTKTDIDNRVMEVIRRPLMIIIISYAVMASLSRLDIPEEFLHYILVIYKVIVIIVIARAISRVCKVIFESLGAVFKKHSKKEVHKTLMPIFQKTLSVIIYFTAIMVIFDRVGIEITPFLASVGVIGLVIAFAAQETLSNLFSGIMILADRPYKVGDILQFDEGYYEVERIGFRSTNVRNIFRNYVVNYPNRVLEKNKIINEFQPDRRYFLFRFMTLDYETDVFKSLDIIRQTAYDHASVIKNDKRHSDPSARIKEFTELGVRVYLWCYIYDWWDQWLANDEILQEILRRFKKEGIKLAYPSRILQFDNRSPLRVSEENFEGIRGMNFEGIHDSSQEVAELSRSNMGMAGMKETVERNQAELRKKGTHVEKKK
ncbi:MAG: mechanosensitive ion channel family protein [Candidatus Thermoplasmatota archaeon]|jgi:MscS family membrane protein|nr:mechanosensitive ion channel family protein [Candidatus Thermoplasmatota archaeon]